MKSLCDFNGQNKGEEEWLPERERESVKLAEEERSRKVSRYPIWGTILHLRLTGEKIKGTLGHLRDDFESEIANSASQVEDSRA